DRAQGGDPRRRRWSAPLVGVKGEEYPSPGWASARAERASAIQAGRCVAASCERESGRDTPPHLNWVQAGPGERRREAGGGAEGGETRGRGRVGMGVQVRERVGMEGQMREGLGMEVQMRERLGMEVQMQERLVVGTPWEQRRSRGRALRAERRGRTRPG